MRLSFAKMEGAGNDFVVLEGAPPDRPDRAQLIVALCDRRRGVGADGALWMERLDGPDHLFRMHFFNNDGGRVNLCLNGARCVARRAIELGWASGEFRFRTELGEVLASEAGDEIVLAVARPRLLRDAIALPQGQASLWDTGDPHLIVELDRERFAALHMPEDGATLRRWPELGPAGANVHFVWREADRNWHIRSFERGVEDETLACGSGCISAFAALAAGVDAVDLRTGGGDRIHMQVAGDALRLRGPARTAFLGHFDWPDL